MRVTSGAFAILWENLWAGEGEGGREGEDEMKEYPRTTPGKAGREWGFATWHRSRGLIPDRQTDRSGRNSAMSSRPCSRLRGTTCIAELHFSVLQS
jgi:hypothetical protein